MFHDLQSSWLLLLQCAAARANYMMRAVELAAAQDSAPSHKSRSHITTTRRQRHRVNASRIGRPWVEECGSHKQGSLLGQLGRLFFDGPATSSTRGCSTGHRAPMQSHVLLLQAASQCRAELTGKMEFAPPSWAALAFCERPPMREPEDREPFAKPDTCVDQVAGWLVLEQGLC